MHCIKSTAPRPLPLRHYNCRTSSAHCLPVARSRIAVVVPLNASKAVKQCIAGVALPLACGQGRSSLHDFCFQLSRSRIHCRSRTTN